MATLQSSNLNRAAYRKKCRQKLSEQILTKLGISVEPAEVRLITSADDPYNWRILPEKQYLFWKHLSKHTIGAYKKLCREVGISFEAILAPKPNNAARGKLLEERRGAMNFSRPEISFTTVIEQLNSDKLELTAELRKSYDQATKATELQALAEEEATQLRLSIQATEMDKQVLQQEVQNLMGVIEYLRNTAVKSVDDFRDRLKLDLNLFSTQ